MKRSQLSKLLCVAVCVLFIEYCNTEPVLQRQARQTGLIFGSQLIPGGSSLLSLINQLPVSIGNSFNAVCQPLTGQSIPTNGCVFVPNIIDSATSRILSCRLECPQGADQLSINLQTIGGVPQPFVAVNPGYLSNGQFSVSDQSGLNAFSGNSYFVIPPSTTAAPATTVASTTATPSASVSTTPITPMTTMMAATITNAQQTAFVAACLTAGTAPATGCTFTAISSDCSQQCCNNGGTLTGNCNFPAGSVIGQCIANGAPLNGGAFTGAAGMMSPLTCSQEGARGPF